MANGESPSNVTVDIGGWFRDAWEYFVQDAVLWIILGLIVYVIMMALAGTTFVLPLLLTGPLFGGMYYAAFSRMKGTEPTVGMLFTPVIDAPVPVILVGLIYSIFVFVAAILCLLPALLAVPLWMFSIPLVIERHMPFWDAMELSRQTVQQQLMQWILFGLVLILLGGVLGSIPLVGFVTIPLSVLLVAVAYRAVFGLPATGPQPGPQAPPA